MPRRESKNGHEQTIVKHQVSVAEQVLMQVFGLKNLCPAIVAEGCTCWIITSAWLTLIPLLSCDKSFLSLLCPGPKYFYSEKVQKEIVKISTCRSTLNFCPHATKTLSRADNFCQEGDQPLGRGKEVEEPSLGKNIGRQKFVPSIEGKLQRASAADAMHSCGETLKNLSVGRKQRSRLAAAAMPFKILILDSNVLFLCNFRFPVPSLVFFSKLTFILRTELIFLFCFAVSSSNTL